MKNKTVRNIAAMSIGLLLISCNKPNEEKTEVASSSNQPAVNQTISFEDQIASLPNTEPLEGMCAGWRRSLAAGRNQNEVEHCLRIKASKDRNGAIQEANEMSEWEIKETDSSELKQLISSLSKFPEIGSLERRLRELSLLPKEPGEYSNLDKALTAADYLTELGNVYWFDTETGMFPNDHHLLLKEIADQSDLSEISFSEVPPSDYDADNEPYQITASINGKTYNKKAENLGDWYDVGAVLSLLNEIALDQGRQSRFVPLPTGDQTSIIWIVEEANLTKLLKDGLVQVGSPELSMQIGKEFEERVKKELVK